MKYKIILENCHQVSISRIVEVNDDPELTELVLVFIRDIGSLRDGDVIRIVEEEEVST